MGQEKLRQWSGTTQPTRRSVVWPGSDSQGWVARIPAAVGSLVALRLSPSLPSGLPHVPAPSPSTQRSHRCLPGHSPSVPHAFPSLSRVPCVSRAALGSLLAPHDTTTPRDVAVTTFAIFLSHLWERHHQGMRPLSGVTISLSLGLANCHEQTPLTLKASPTCCRHIEFCFRAPTTLKPPLYRSPSCRCLLPGRTSPAPVSPGPLTPLQSSAPQPGGCVT